MAEKHWQRYERQMVMAGIGEEGQQKLSQARVLVIGAGGLGSPALYYLCGAGVGNITIVDADVVSESNLNRQILHGQEDVGKPKVISAQEMLNGLNPHVNIIPKQMLLAPENIQDTLMGMDLVVDCVDNAETRYMVNAACVGQNIPLVEAGVQGFDGYVLPIYPHKTACFQCVYPTMGKNKEGPIPILGATAGAIGAMQAATAIRMLVGLPVAAGKLSLFTLGNLMGTQLEVDRRADCPICGGAIRPE
ncbi:HesA/MoeB/ThiF family protein [Eubacteriales bacterium OttesenSCG-928-M02]|nr:HesA/MoeB/ThiF family protein [Eubacteriales bacterium OttesenSCG-928-M02]